MSLILDFNFFRRRKDSPNGPAVCEETKAFWMLKAGRAIFKFFASLKLAIPVLSSLMAVLAAGTFIESYHGSDAARILVYDSPWFSLLLILLGINVSAAALDRLPWKRKHVGFLLTHLGIILILTGSFVTRKFAIEGQIAAAEGETEHRITLFEPLLFIFPEDGGREWVLPLKKKAFAWTGKKEILRDPNFPGTLSLVANYPKARMRESIIPAAPGSPSSSAPALQVTLHNSFLNQSQWLVQNDPALGELQAGPAKLRFTDELLKETPADAAPSGTAALEFQFEKSNLRIPVPENLKVPASFALEGTPYRIEITGIFKNALVEGNQLMEDPKRAEPEMGNNPAVELILSGEGLREKHSVFAKFPDFPTTHGMKPSAAGVKIFYRRPGAGESKMEKEHELRFVTERGAEKAGGLFYQIKTGEKVRTGTAVTGEEVKTGWMDLQFHVDKFYPSAQISREFTPEPAVSENPELLPVIALRLEKKGEAQTLWLRQGVHETLDLPEGRFHFVYGQKRIPAGFRLKLRDFRVENYPGTNRPASFESDVTLLDDSHGVVRDALISMNKPLVYRGFRIYQSGYTIEPGQPEVSIFSVGRDPGVPLKYGGTLVMVAGILTMFYTRKYSSTPEAQNAEE